jgi:hypothetical protein
MTNKCRQCGGRAELGVTNEARTAVVWLCERCAKQVGATVSPTLGAKMAAGAVDGYALRVRTGVQCAAGDVLKGISPSYRPVATIEGLGQEREYVGEWINDEAEATRAAETMGAELRKIIAARALEVGNN